MYVNGRDIRNSWGNAVREKGGRSRASGEEMEKPGENESCEVTPREGQGSRVKTSTERQDSQHAGDSRGDAVWGRRRRRRGVRKRARNSGGGGSMR